MKSKKKHLTSSDDSEQTDDGEKSSSSSESDSEDSSASEHRYKKKRKRADSSDSDSGSDYQKRSKKRKNKKKKKKHGKKKRRSEDVGVTNDDVSSGSDGEISSKKKHKNKHKDSKRSYGSSGSEIEEVRVERRILSVVKEKRHLTEDPIQTSRTYYQKEYHLSSPQEGFDRTHEVQRFYRGSSKERKQQYNEQYYERDRNERYQLYQPPKYDKYNDRYGHNIQYNDSHEDINRRPQEFDEYKRQQRYNIEHRPQEEYRTRRPRDDNYQHREENRGYRPNHYENRGPRRRDFEDNREYRERAGPSESEHYRDRDYQDKKEKFHEERFSNDRNRDMGRRDRPGPGSRPGPGPGPRPGPGPGRLNKPPHQDRFNRSEDARPGPRGPGPRSERPPPPRDDKPRERKSRFTDGENKEYAWGKVEVKKEGANPTDKEKPNFGLSGKLTEDQNTVNGVVIKYTEPDDAKQPKRRWRFYPFKGDKALPILYIHRQSAFLIGRDKKVVDIALEHPSVSKQHAALQYRATAFTRDDGSQGRRVRPYIVDLESANGTFVNNKKIEPRRYVELLERDVVKFGFSQREYVLLHENSKDDAQDDDNEPAPTNQPVTTTQQVKQEKRARQEVAEDGE